MQQLWRLAKERNVIPWSLKKNSANFTCWLKKHCLVLWCSVLAADCLTLAVIRRKLVYCLWRITRIEETHILKLILISLLWNCTFPTSRTTQYVFHIKPNCWMLTSYLTRTFTQRASEKSSTLNESLSLHFQASLRGTLTDTRSAHTSVFHSLNHTGCRICSAETSKPSTLCRNRGLMCHVAFTINI